MLKRLTDEELLAVRDTWFTKENQEKYPKVFEGVSKKIFKEVRKRSLPILKQPRVNPISVVHVEEVDDYRPCTGDC